MYSLYPLGGRERKRSRDSVEISTEPVASRFDHIWDPFLRGNSTDGRDRLVQNGRDVPHIRAEGCSDMIHPEWIFSFFFFKAGSNGLALGNTLAEYAMRSARKHSLEVQSCLASVRKIIIINMEFLAHIIKKIWELRELTIKIAWNILEKCFVESIRFAIWTGDESIDSYCDDTNCKC